MVLLFLGSLPHFCFQGVYVSLLFSCTSHRQGLGLGLAPAGQGHASHLAGKPGPR